MSTESSNLMKILGPTNFQLSSGEVFNIDKIAPIQCHPDYTINKAESTQGTQLAVKIIYKNSSVPAQVVQNEVTVLAKNKEISTIRTNYGNIDYPLNNLICLEAYAEDDKYFYIAMEYYDQGALTKLINNSMLKSETETIEHFRQLCYGIWRLHSQNIIHRDLKSDNVFAKTNKDKDFPMAYKLAIGDLGLAKKIEVNMTINVGTLYTMAPEVSTGVYGASADIYSLGCVLYKMLCKKEPFTGSTTLELENMKSSNNISIRGKYSKFTMKLLEGCLQFDPKKRINIEKLCKMLKLSKLYTDYSPLVLNEVDPSNAINLKEFVRGRYIFQSVVNYSVTYPSSYTVVQQHIIQKTLGKNEFKSKSPFKWVTCIALLVLAVLVMTMLYRGANRPRIEKVSDSIPISSNAEKKGHNIHAINKEPAYFTKYARTHQKLSKR